MWKRWATGRELANQCWAVLRQNRELIVFPLISTAALIVISILFIIPIGATGILNASSNHDNSGPGILSFIIFFLYYLVTYTVIIYCNTALVGSVFMLMRGEKPTLSDGLKIANKRIGNIAVYAAISATVGIIARGIAQAGRGSKNIVLAIIFSIIGGTILAAWTAVTYLVIPILVVENVNAMEALKRSFTLFKKTWGEQFLGGLSLGAMGCLLFLGAAVPGLLVLMLGVGLSSTVLMVIGVLALIIGIAFVALITNAVNTIFQAALYTYATTGNAGSLLDTQLVAKAFFAKGAQI